MVRVFVFMLMVVVMRVNGYIVILKVLVLNVGQMDESLVVSGVEDNYKYEVEFFCILINLLLLLMEVLYCNLVV